MREEDITIDQLIKALQEAKVRVTASFIKHKPISEMASSTKPVETCTADIMELAARTLSAMSHIMRSTGKM